MNEVTTDLLTSDIGVVTLNSGVDSPTITSNQSCRGAYMTLLQAVPPNLSSRTREVSDTVSPLCSLELNGGCNYILGYAFFFN